MAKIADTPSRKKSGSRFGQAPSATIVDLSLAAVAKNASVVWEKGDSGKITDLKLRWPTPNGLAATQEIKISYWLEFPLLSEPIADALLTWGADKTERTRISVIGALRTHFFPILRKRRTLKFHWRTLIEHGLLNFVPGWIKGHQASDQ